MAHSLVLTLLLSLSVFGSTSMQRDTGTNRQSPEERRLLVTLAKQGNSCPDAECRTRAFQTIAEIIRLRRSIYVQLMSEPTLSRLKESCDQHQEDLELMLSCLRARQNVSFEEGMKLAGYTRAGITAEGYSQLRIGMEMREVEYILGDYGEEVSYAASRGYSASLYQWKAGRRIIVVTFSDYKLSARSQSGLY